MRADPTRFCFSDPVEGNQENCGFRVAFVYLLRLPDIHLTTTLLSAKELELEPRMHVYMQKHVAQSRKRVSRRACAAGRHMVPDRGDKRRAGQRPRGPECPNRRREAKLYGTRQPALAAPAAAGLGCGQRTIRVGGAAGAEGAGRRTCDSCGRLSAPTRTLLDMHGLSCLGFDLMWVGGWARTAVAEADSRRRFRSVMAEGQVAGRCCTVLRMSPSRAYGSEERHAALRSNLSASRFNFGDT
ncbi:hypothetical protein DFH11DRAFT_785203 [Phellopilus nigrolimitatus]|nr:hypothetical protein DFH11DRAFT_785203 [Phellopilus nigrolimitatus]